MKGNVMDMAIGIIIGAAFGKIVSSFVADVLMPPLGLLMGGGGFTNKFLILRGGAFDTLDAAKKAGAVTMNYGLFLNTVIDFLIIAFAIFIMVKQVNRLKWQPEASPAPPSTKDCPYCLSAIPIKASRWPEVVPMDLETDPMRTAMISNQTSKMIRLSSWRRRP